MTGAEFNQCGRMDSELQVMKCALPDALNEQNGSTHIQNKNEVCCFQYYSQNIDHYELARFRNLRLDLAIRYICTGPLNSINGSSRALAKYNMTS
jgi:hypothetical protein